MTNFNFTFQPGTSSEQIIGFEMAGRIWSQYLQDDAAFDVHVVAADSLPPTIIGGAVPEFGAANIVDIEAALSQDTTSAYDIDAVDSIGTLLSPDDDSQYSAVLNDVKSQSGNLAITNANAKALGWQETSEPDAIDGYIVFNDLSNSTYGWDYDFSRTSKVSSQDVDFLGMALHELGHIMGFTSGVDIIESADGPAGLNNTSLFDLFRYSERSTELNAIEMTAGEEVYFSLDGGQTSLASLSTGYVEGDDTTGGFQASHWQYQPEESDSGLFSTQGSSSRSLFSTLLPTVSTLLPTVSAITDLALYTVGTLASPVLNLVGQVGQRIISPPADLSQLPESVGIMDEVAVPGTRPNISDLDLIALDVIGYDISDTASSSINYNALLKETETALSEALGVDIDGLDNVLNLDPLIQDKQADLEDLFERRRSRRRSRSFLFFQDTDSTAADDTAQAFQSQPVELTELSNIPNSQSSPSESSQPAELTELSNTINSQKIPTDSERIDQSAPNIVSERTGTSTNVTQPTQAHSTGEPQSNLESRYGIGQPETSSVDSLISYNYGRSRFSPWARSSRRDRLGRSRKFSTRLSLFETNSQLDRSFNRSVDQLASESLESTYSGLGSTSSTTPTSSYGNDDSPWRNNAVEALGVESVKQMLSSWWG